MWTRAFFLVAPSTRVVRREVQCLELVLRGEKIHKVSRKMQLHSVPKCSPGTKPGISPR